MARYNRRGGNTGYTTQQPRVYAQEEDKNTYYDQE